MSVGQLIRDARLAEGLTQAQLARRLGITQPSVARLERAGAEVSVQTVQRALDAMDRALVLGAREREVSHDETLIRANLALTPAERLQRMTAGHARFKDLAAATAAAAGAAATAGPPAPRGVGD